uniref:Acid sensing ion channel subunit 1 n=1 Tax=Ursus americanus TaxID=9643 RepID=A0A452QNY2_URSAM
MELKAEEEEVGGVQPVSIQAFASSSTLHGLAHIFSYERLSLKRALWALCFLGSLAVLLCVCTERVQYYFHYHHVTKLDEVAASQLTFPAVTLCNLNEFRFSQVSKNDLYHAGELLALYEIPDTQMADEKQLEILQDKANFRSFKPKPFNMREFYDRAGHDIRDMLLSCHFRGEVCSAEDFKVGFHGGDWGRSCVPVSGWGPEGVNALAAAASLQLHVICPWQGERLCGWNAEQHRGEGAGRWRPSQPSAAPSSS